MMRDGININQRDVILVPFPFSDLSSSKNLSSSKKRPAFVVSNTSFNRRNQDIVCCSITSNIKDTSSSIIVTNNDMEKGYLEFESRVKSYRIFTVDKSIIYKVLGRLNKEKSKQIVSEIKSLVDIE